MHAQIRPFSEKSSIFEEKSAVSSGHFTFYSQNYHKFKVFSFLHIQYIMQIFSPFDEKKKV